MGTPGAKPPASCGRLRKPIIVVMRYAGHADIGERRFFFAHVVDRAGVQQWMAVGAWKLDDVLGLAV